jgi:hypothetical protein
MQSPKHKLFDADLQPELHTDINALVTYSVVGVTSEISPMWVFEWWREQLRPSCRYDIRKKSQMNLPAVFMTEPFDDFEIKNRENRFPFNDPSFAAIPIFRQTFHSKILKSLFFHRFLKASLDHSACIHCSYHQNSL